ncbi:ComEC/Rec2 family competence protein [Mesorhizobium sp.]|uniref:ComEC/Rec2 family competence protein n=1 Tax=Mesorhizobium sp. TaxID=1871066 RepID=UPI0025DE6392|nr:hypothetical protein [Mesorhizobium sp.]
MFRIHMLPAGDGDCFLVETGDAPHRILIDGGRSITAGPYLRAMLDSFPNRPGPKIDLMVLTHIDADHIEGLLTLIPTMNKGDVGEFWFNGLKHVRVANGQNAEVPTVIAAKPAERVLSIRQGFELTRMIELLGWPWNSLLPKGVAMINARGPLPAIPLPDGTITLLGPPQAKLRAFAKEWEFWFRRLFKAAPVLAAIRKPLTQISLAALAASRDKPDTAKPNGTSITFVIEHKGKRALFCADAHPGDLAEAVTRYGGIGRVYFDAVKVAHHGSAANNTSTLIDRLASPLWLVSSDGSRHSHPDPEAIARILLAPCRDKRLVFNYRSRFNGVWENPELADQAAYRPIFPTGPGPTFVDLL